jgi:hypothetical protein
MKLDFLADATDYGDIIRLYDFTQSEVKRLRDLIQSLESGDLEQVELHSLPFVSPVDGCRLTLKRRSWDQAVIRLGSEKSFECSFTEKSWGAVADLVEPFEANGAGHQWLSGTPGEAALLLSQHGDW